MDRILGLDIGTKRIGVAQSDALGITAQPLKAVQRTPEEKAIEEIKQLCNASSIKKIVVGLPKNMDNSIGSQAQECIDFAEKLKPDFEIIFEDERLTSRQAEYFLQQAGKKYTKNKELVDIKSACIILQQYLDRK